MWLSKENLSIFVSVYAQRRWWFQKGLPWVWSLHCYCDWSGISNVDQKIHRILTKLANYAHKHISSDFLLSWLDLESFHLKGSSTPKKWCGSSSMSMSNVPMDIGQVHVQSSKSDIYTVYLVQSITLFSVFDEKSAPRKKQQRSGREKSEIHVCLYQVFKTWFNFLYNFKSTIFAKSSLC